MIISKRKKILDRTCPVLVSALSLVLLSACAPPQWNGNQPSDNRGTKVPVRVFFDGNGCPTDVDPRNFERAASSGDQVQWLAHRGSGDTAVFDESIVFAVYFDPFIDGKTLFSKKGKALSSKININAAAKTPKATDVFYKYSVVGKGCEEQPLDPRMVIAR